MAKKKKIAVKKTKADKIIELIESHKCSYDCCDYDGNPTGDCKFDIAREVREFLEKKKK